ncbi:MAG: hypothetical protein AAB525_04350 [Patescibacteria group bacterium]
MQSKNNPEFNQQTRQESFFAEKLGLIIDLLENVYCYVIQEDEREGENDRKILNQLLRDVFQEYTDGKINIASYGAETILRFIAYKLNISVEDAHQLHDLFYEKGRRQLSKGEKRIGLHDLFEHIARQNEKKNQVLGFDGSKDYDSSK